MKILGTGLTGLLGSRIVELLSKTYTFENVSRSTGVDITKRDEVITKIASSDAQWVFHLAAKTNVDGCEEEKGLGEAGEAWKINVLGTKNVVDACLQSNKRLLYVSTDFVFDGKNPPENGYTEEDEPNPINWYGQTKYEAEKIVSSSLPSALIARIAYPYKALENNKDFLHVVKNRLEKGETVFCVTNHIFSPTYIDDVANALELLIKQDKSGIFHITGTGSLSPYDAAVSIVSAFGFNKSLVEKTTLEEFFVGRAPRPFCLPMNNAKIEQLGIKMHTFEEGLAEVKNQCETII